MTSTAGVDVDVLVIGAGISGIGAGWHLQTMSPDRTYAILEGRDDLGGTWDLFRYPGIRSDSDMHTLGYQFKPWTEAKSIADGPSIRAYPRETAADYGIDRHIHYRQWVSRAEWSGDDARWTVTATRVDPQTGEAAEVQHRCRFLFMCDVPNLASSFGYINASWTLRSDLTCASVCRLLNHMTETGTDVATPRLRLSDRTMPVRPWVDDFSGGYLQRVMHAMPRQGDRDPWRNTQSYDEDRKLLAKDPVDDGVMTFTVRSRLPAFSERRGPGNSVRRKRESGA